MSQLGTPESSGNDRYLDAISDPRAVDPYHAAVEAERNGSRDGRREARLWTWHGFLRKPIHFMGRLILIQAGS
jgi:hypothetical protein